MSEAESDFSYEITEQHCEKHGVQVAGYIYAEVVFCPVCLRDKLLELGLVPIHQRKKMITLRTK